MDQIIREAIRLLQCRNDFESLCLDEILDEKALDGLLKTVIIARLKKHGIELFNYQTSGNWEYLPPETLLIKQNKHTPRILITKTFQSYHLTNEISYPITTWEQLPVEILLNIAGTKWFTEKETPKIQRISDVDVKFVSKIVLVHKFGKRNRADIYVANKWQETAESFEAYKNKLKTGLLCECKDDGCYLVHE